ncbi:hypothetical protein AB0910_10710 [Streptomyces sp. NPDC047002]|uniref:hypothetical protein n=1 Tax=Streptomyces sp. NPDC047002 TaxID=3155475 RepID=UPI003451E8FC
MNSHDAAQHKLPSCAPVITRIRSRATEVRARLEAHRRGFQEGFDSARRRHSRAMLSDVQQSLNGMQAGWQIPRAVADGVQAWAFSAALWFPFRKWCLRMAFALWFVVLLVATEYPFDHASLASLSGNAIVDTAPWLRLKSISLWHHPGLALEFLRHLAMRWIFIVLILYGLFRWAPNAEVHRRLEPPQWTHPLQRLINSLVWAATLERRFRSTAALAYAANRCGVAYTTPRTPWGPSAAEMAERALLNAERTVLNAWRRWPRRSQRAVKDRRMALQQHAGLVAAALRKEARRLDGPDCDEALKRIAEMLITIGERYSDGHLGALLPENDLEGLTAVRHREGWQLTLMVGGIVAVTGGAVAVGLPDGATAVAIPALAGLVMWWTNKRRGGRETHEAFDLFRPR